MLVTYGEQHQRRRESWSSFRNQYIIQFVEQQKFIVRLQLRLLHSSINSVLMSSFWKKKKWTTLTVHYLVRENTLRKFIFEMIEKKVGFNLNQIIHIHKVLEKHDKNIVVAFFSMLNFAFLLFILIWKYAFSLLIITFQPRKHSYFLCLIFFFSLWLIFFLFW